MTVSAVDRYEKRHDHRRPMPAASAPAAQAFFICTGRLAPGTSPPPLTPPHHSLREWREGNREMCVRP